MSCSRRNKLLLIWLNGGCCSWCGEQGDNESGPDGRPWTIDRVYPGKLGGGYTRDNIALACHRCNSSKGARDWGVQATLESMTRWRPVPSDIEGWFLAHEVAWEFSEEKRLEDAMEQAMVQSQQRVYHRQYYQHLWDDENVPDWELDLYFPNGRP